MTVTYNGKKWAITGLKKPHRKQQGFGQHTEVGTVNGWRALLLVNWGDEISVNGEDFFPHFLQPLL